MNEVQPYVAPARPDPKLLALTAAERLRAAEALAKDIAANVVEVGRHAWAAKEAGDDMAPWRRLWGSMLGLFLQIGCGRIWPGVYARFGTHPRLYNAIKGLDLHDQRTLAEGALVPLVVYGPDGNRTLSMRDPIDLRDSPGDLKQVFARDHIRSEAEQAAVLDHQHKEAARPKSEVVGKLRVDRVARVYRIGNHVITEAEFEAARKVMRG